MNSKLKDLVQRIIAAPLTKKGNEVTAKEIMYGKDGMDFDYMSYYENLISEFSKNVQSSIMKIEDNLYYDIGSNKYELWNMIFLGQFLSKQMLDKYNVEISSSIEVGRYNEIRKILSTFENRCDYVSINFPAGVSMDLEQLKKVKQSLLLVQKLKDSFMHTHGCNDYSFDNSNEVISVSNDGGRFPITADIPVQYIEGFLKQCIVPNQADKKTAIETDKIVFPLLKKMGLNPLELSNFFYRVNQETLNYLISLYDGDVTQLYKLSEDVFFQNVDYLKYLVGLKNDKNILVNLPTHFFNLESTSRKLIEKYGIDAVSKFPEKSFDYTFNHDYFIKKWGIQNFCRFNYMYCYDELDKIADKYDIEVALKLDGKLLFDYDHVIRLIDLYGIDFVSKLPNNLIVYSSVETLVEKYGKDNVVKFPKDFFNKAVVNEAIKFIDKYGIGIIGEFDSIFKSGILADYQLSSLDRLIEKYGKDEIKKLDSLYPLFIFNNTNNLNEKIFNFIDLYGIETLKKIDRFSNVIEGNIGMYTVDVIRKVPKLIFIPYDIGINCIERYGLDSLFNLNDYVFCERGFQLLMKYGPEIVSKLPGTAFENKSRTEHFIEKFGAEVTFNLLPEMFSSHFGNAQVNFYDKFISSFLIFSGNDASAMRRIPCGILNHSLILLEDEQELVSKITNVYTTYNEAISKCMFGMENPKVIALMIYSFSVLGDYDYNSIGQNKTFLKNLASIKLNDNDKRVVGMELENHTNRNELNDNAEDPCDSVFCKLINNLINYGKYDILENKKLDFEESSLVAIGRKINEDINRVLRNATSHFRFNEVRDAEGNLIENKVKVYDINEKGVTTFEQVYDIDFLFEYISSIDQFLKSRLPDKMFDEILSDLNSVESLPNTNLLYTSLSTKTPVRVK